MKNINSTYELSEAINSLSLQQSSQGKLLKDQFLTTIRYFKPANLIKETLDDVVNSPDLVKNIVSTSLGITTGFITKKAIIRNSGNIFLKLLGNIIQIGVTTAIATHPDEVKAAGGKIIKMIFKRSHKNQ
ncbi:MAG: hypothetical protein Q8S23_05010 [Bacteroidales bacterium]|jgi:hypothetical protein|nr:hypothetical protein [Bacteroidales bacterium]